MSTSRKPRTDDELPEAPSTDLAVPTTATGVLVRAAQNRSLSPITDAARDAAIAAATPVWQEAKPQLVPVAHVAGAATGLGALGNLLAQTPGALGPAALAAVVAGPAAWYYSRALVEREFPQPLQEVDPRDHDAVMQAAEELGEHDAKIGSVRRFIGTAAGAASAWLASAAAMGIDPSTLGGKVNLTVGALLTLWAGSPYVRFRNRPIVEAPQEPIRVEAVIEEPPMGWAVYRAEMISAWEQRCARDNTQVLYGTHLDPDSMVEIKGGWKGTIASDTPGGVDPKRFIPAVDRVAAAYEVGLTDVSIEVLAENASKASLTLLRDNPLVNFQHWPGPYARLGEEQEASFDSETGVALIGLHSDGEHARYRFWNAGGAWHDLISGATGSGKSEFVNLLLAMERHAYVEVPVLLDDGSVKLDDDGQPVTVRRGLIVSRIGDPQWGQSFGDWQDHVDWFAPVIDEIRTMLQKTEREMYARNKAFGRKKWYDEKLKKWRRGVKNWRPTPDNPMISITLDEAHEILKDPECARIVAILGKMGRKVGIKLRLITQVPLLQELGNNMAIRDAVASGNVVIFRTANGLSGQVAFNGTLPVSPHQLPREWPKGKAKPGQETTAGIGYVLGASSRAAVMRAFYAGDAVDWIYGPDGEEIGYPGVLDEATRRIGVGYEDRHQRLRELDDDDDVPESSIAHAKRGKVMTCEQAVLDVFLAKKDDDYTIKLEDLVAAIPTDHGQRQISNVLRAWRKRAWLVSGEEAGKHGLHKLTQAGRDEAPVELARDDYADSPEENPAAAEQRALARA